MKLKSILAFLAAAAGAFSPLPAFAADGYPRVEVGGYFETLYEVESFVAGGKERGETFNAFQTSPVHLGIFTLTTTFELNPAVDGVVEIFPLAKFKPVLTGPNEYVDIVGNGNDARSTLAGRVQATLREPFGWDGSLTVGLIRVPFGYWDDFSVERDIFQAKVNTEIFGGSPLRRLDYGASWEGNVPHLAGGKLAYRLATVSRSSPLAGANNIDLADYVGRLAWVADWGEVGLNGYMVDIKDGPIGTKGALGVDYRFNLPFNLTLLGEYVDQEDRALGIYSRGIYTRLNYDLSDVVPGLRPFVGYEHSFDNVGSAGVWSDNESTYLAGIRYSVYHGVTLGCELLVGDSDLHSGGNLINRLEVRF